MDDALRLQNLFQVLADANRLRIIKYVGLEERSVSEIVNAVELSQPLVSHHLKVLRQMKILETKRNGPFIIHFLKDGRLLDTLGIFLELSTCIDKYECMETPMFCSPKGWGRRRYKRRKFS